MKLSMLGFLFFSAALATAAAARAPQLPASEAMRRATAGQVQSAGTTADMNSTGPVRNGLPVLNKAKFGHLNLDNLPTGPNGTKMVASVNGVPITEEHFISALKDAVGPVYKSDPQRAETPKA